MIKRAALLLLPFLAATVVLAACGGNSSSSSFKPNPSESAAAHKVEQRGLTALEKCTPNGKAMIGAVVNQNATLLTYRQLYKTFKSRQHRDQIWTCISTRPGPVPAPQMKAALEKCFGASNAVTSAVRHPIRALHHAKDAALALVNAAAYCAGKYA